MADKTSEIKNRPKKLKYEQKFITEYKVEFGWIVYSVVGDTLAFCTLCRSDVKHRTRGSRRSSEAQFNSMACNS
jgi:hypothetical protein